MTQTTQRQNLRGIFDSTPTRHFGITGGELDGISYRILGPVFQWGADLITHRSDPASIKAAVVELTSRLNGAVAGYFYTKDDLLCFHMTRLPRRVGEAVPSIQRYSEIATELTSMVAQFDSSVVLRFDDRKDCFERYVIG